MDIAVADTGIVAIVAISGLISLIRGFVKEAMSLVIWVAAFVIAMTFSEAASGLLVNFIELALRQLAAWGGLFVSTLLAGAVVNFLLEKLVSSTGLGGTDEHWVWFLAYLVLTGGIGLVIALPKAIPVEQDPWWQESTLIPYFKVSRAGEGKRQQISKIY